LEDGHGRESEGVKFRYLPAFGKEDALELWRSYRLRNDGTDDQLIDLFDFFGFSPIVIDILAGSIKKSEKGFPVWMVQQGRQRCSKN